MEGDAVDTIAHTETAERELDAYSISRRSEARQNDPDTGEELYLASVRRYNAQRDEQRWWERLHAAEDRIRAHTATFDALIAHHEREASRCRPALGLEDNEERKTA